MKIKRPKCQIYFYSDQLPTDTFDFKDLISTAVKNNELKKNIEFIKIIGFDEKDRKISIRFDFGSLIFEDRITIDIKLNEKLRTERLFGEILVHMGHITKEQLNECLSLQTDSHFDRKLGEILIEKNYIKPTEVIEALTHQIGENYLKKQNSNKD